MHNHLEVIIPPTDNIEESIRQVLAPFDENDDQNLHAFWDWYVIGGRWSGAKITDTFDEERLTEFYAALTDAKITVSAVQAGKESIQPASQIPQVDAIWNEHFPEAPMKVCPLFDHYKGSSGDVMPLRDVSLSQKASAVLIAGPHWDEAKNELKAKFIIQESLWNGVNYVDSEWDGGIHDALKMYLDETERMAPDYATRCTPQGDWLVVTVDYHS